MKKKPQNANDEECMHGKGTLLENVYTLTFGSEAHHAFGTKKVVIVIPKLSFMLIMLSPVNYQSNEVWAERIEKLLTDMAQQQQQILAILAALQTQHSTSDDLLDNHDLCALLHVGTRTLHRWRSEGKLPPSKLIGGKHYYTRKAIMDMFNLK